MAIEVMGEQDIDISDQEPKNVSEYLGRLSVGISIIVCAGAEREMSACLSRHDRIECFGRLTIRPHSSVTQTATIEEFRKVRDEIEARIKQWLKETP